MINLIDVGACHLQHEEVVVGALAEIFIQVALNIDDGFNDIWAEVLVAQGNDEVGAHKFRQ